MAFIVFLGLCAAIAGAGLIVVWLSIRRGVFELIRRYLVLHQFRSPDPDHEYRPLFLNLPNPESVNLDEVVFVVENPFARKKRTPQKN